MSFSKIRSLRLNVPIALSLSLGCAGLLGIEDATCDPDFDARCRQGSISLPSSGAGGGLGESAGSAGLEIEGSAAAAAGSTPALGVEPPAGTLCDRYCQAMAANCVETDQQYVSPEACLAVCERLDPGEPGDSGSTVECRLARAELAARTGEPWDYCPAAGPGGAGICGSDCEGFCAVMTATCEQLGSLEACMGACAMVPDLSRPPTNATYNTTQQSGNSLQCRLFHVTAASLDPVGHCVHAAGIAVCSP